MNKTVYIHYGASEFDRNAFKPIRNGRIKVKPYGGLWASPVDSKWGWKEWCTSENFHVDQLDSSFSFVLSDGARVLHLRSGEDVDKLPRYCPFPQMLDWTMRWIDFEKITKVYDAVELHLSEDQEHIASYNSLYFKMNGWDCDSILIMNPDIVAQISVEKEESK